MIENKSDFGMEISQDKNVEQQYSMQVKYEITQQRKWKNLQGMFGGKQR